MTMRLPHALSQESDVRIFRVDNAGEFDFDEISEWTVIPLAGDILEEKDGFFILRAFQVLVSGETVNCFIDLTMPERIADHTYFFSSGAVVRKPLHECNGEIICAVPIDGFGQYDLFYSRTKPELGVSVLNQGLERASQKTFIAEDLGYILRDERRLEEAAQAFSVSASEGPSSLYIYLELAETYDKLGEPNLAAEYRARSQGRNSIAKKKPWWKL